MNKSTQRRLAVVALAVLAIALAVAGWLNRDYLVVKREDVRFQSGELTLAGTLFRPRAGERLPAVVLIHGSGAADRRSMSEFARALASHGMAALAYDKRGVGESQGDPEEWKRFNFDHLAQDAVAAFNLLSERTDIDPERIGFLGASQGGWVAPLAASREPRAAFLILVSASVTTVGEDRLFERAARLQQEGFAPHEIEEVRTMQIVDDDVTRSGARYDEFCQLWNANKTKRWFSRVYLDSEPTPPNHPWREWYRTVIDFNPVPILERLSIPALFLFGEPRNDRLGPVAESVRNVEALRNAGHDCQAVVFDGADHSLRLVDGGVLGKLWPRRAPYERTVLTWLDAHRAQR